MGSLCNKRKKQIPFTIEETSSAGSMIVRNDKKKETSAQISIGGHIFKNEMPFSQFCDDYEDMEVLGNGGFGVVQKVRHIRTNEIRAMKIIGTNELTQNINNGKHLIREITILKKLVFLLITGSPKYFKAI